MRKKFLELPLYLDEKMIKIIAKQKPSQRLLNMLKVNQFFIDLKKKSKYAKNFNKIV